MNVIHKYFPDLSQKQIDQFTQLKELYVYWNERINVISRKDIDNIYVHHVLHSLAIGKIHPLVPNQKILDVGTGGGFPGIPLAILFPECEFMLVDSIGKKIKVVNEVSSNLGLKNLRAQQTRIENHKTKYNFVVSRAVTDLVKFTGWATKNVMTSGKNNAANGILYLKGGDVEEDIKNIKYPVRVYNLMKYFDEDFFETKLLVYIQVANN
jgi:16S rRNA (guanine527-N7)-methyltransferase